MTISRNDAFANMFLDGIDPVWDNGTLEFRTGGGAGASNAANGTLLGSGTLPANALGAASGRAKPKAGTWAVTIAAAGTIGHYRLTSADATKVEEGVCAVSPGAGIDMTVSAVVVGIGDTVTVNSYNYTHP